MSGRATESGTYRVAPSDAAGSTAGLRPPVAVFVAHGMGQQIRFQTLESVAEGLLTAAAAAHAKPVAKTVSISGERLQRLELDIGGRQVHLYEGYWAPLTEGKITLRDVVVFLLRSGVAGLCLGVRDFRRWLFGSYARFPAPVRTVVYLLLALAVVTALIVLNAIVVTLAAARLPFYTAPAWLTPALFRDVTTILNAAVVLLLPFLLVLAWSAWQRGRRAARRVLLGATSIATFAIALWTIVAAAMLAAAAVVFHLSHPGANVSMFGPRAAGILHACSRGFDAAATGLVWAAVLGGSVWLVWVLVRELRVVDRDSATRALTIGVFAAFLAFAGGLLALAGALWMRPLRGILGFRFHGLAWPLVVGIAVGLRSLLIEYVGDVAAYVQPQALDRFFTLRQSIKDIVGRTARAIYADPQYRDVILVGHSLGSVVVYDVLNRLILDHQLDAAAPEITSRTRLLLTFGSPLDKTAFIFGTQGTGREAREALAASVQPLIADPRARPPWINIWSPWDIISGHLDYYDLPGTSDPRRVANIVDPMARTLLVAHVEYWNNPLVFRTIIDHLG